MTPRLPVSTPRNQSTDMSPSSYGRGLPAGVLYDLVAAPSQALPWRLVIHFRSFPDRTLPTYSGEAGLRAAFFNSLKEAACICRGSAQRVMEMAAGAQAGLRRRFACTLRSGSTLRVHASGSSCCEAAAKFLKASWSTAHVVVF